MIVLEPNSATPTGPWTEGDVDNVLIGIENHDDFTQANIESGRVAYSVGIIYGMSSQKGFSGRVIKMLYYFFQINLMMMVTNLTLNAHFLTLVQIQRKMMSH